MGPDTMKLQIQKVLSEQPLEVKRVEVLHEVALSLETRLEEMDKQISSLEQRK